MHLEGVALALRSAEAQSPDIHFEGLSTKARTLTTTERRLGICKDRFITYFFLCDVCWKVHHPSDLSKLHSPTCDQDGCAGTLYTSKWLSSGSDKQTPTKIMPYVRLKKAVQHLLLRPGKYEQLQHWRYPELDEPRPAKPFIIQGYDAFIDPSISMTDVYDGWGWRAIQAGLERRRGGKWTIEDVDVHELHQRFVSLPLGLVFQMNIDWYVVYLMICVIVNHCVYRFQAVDRSSHSSGALYLTLCNNPRNICYIREETILLMAIPGPIEPSLDEMNNIMEPVVEDFLDLGKGMSSDFSTHYNTHTCTGAQFRVHGHEQREIAHCQLQANVSDLPASRKVSGLAGHMSKHFMCPFCEMPFYRLVDPNCYDPLSESQLLVTVYHADTVEFHQHSNFVMIGGTSNTDIEHATLTLQSQMKSSYGVVFDGLHSLCSLAGSRRYPP
jgi:hypothetical protein